MSAKVMAVCMLAYVGDYLFKKGQCTLIDMYMPDVTHEDIFDYPIALCNRCRKKLG